MAAPEVFSGCACLSDVSTGDWPDVMEVAAELVRTFQAQDLSKLD